MDIVLTGGTGYVGRAVLARLVEQGHAVQAVVRSDASAVTVEAAGARAVRGDLLDADWLAGVLADADGLIHAAAAGDADDARRNDAVIDAATRSLTGKPFVLTGGVWTHGNGDDLADDGPQDPPAITAWRPEGEQRVLSSSTRGSVVRPGIVYGYGGGIPAMLAEGPRDADGALVLIGTGDQHWTTVHVDDLADLYVRVLTDAPGGSAYLGVNGDNPTVRSLGEALGEPVVAGSAQEASDRLGEPFAEALLLDQQARGTAARALGWTPTAPTLGVLLAEGYPGDR